MIFINDSDEERRLSVDLTVPPRRRRRGRRSPAEVHHARRAGGRQNITLTIGAPSFAAPDGYFFFVPGVESARLELIVP